MKMKGITLLCDESSMISNERAQRTRGILKMYKQGRIEHVVLLSGTPIDGKYERLLSQCWLLGWNIPRKEFLKRYVIYTMIQPPGMPFPIRVIHGYKNEGELKDRLREKGAHFLKVEDCLSSLPSQTFIYSKSTPPAAYKKMLKTGMCEINGEKLVADDVLTRRLYLRQLCGQYNDDRYAAISDLLEMTEERVLIFYNFKAEKERIVEICQKLKKPISEVSGSRKDLEAYESEPESVTLIQYQAGAMGLNLQKARITIYTSLPERSELFEQSKCRTWRQGQTKPCLYYICKSPDTIEDDIETALKQKKNYTDFLFERGYEYFEEYLKDLPNVV